MEDYLKEFYQEEIVNLLNDNDDCLHVSINLNLSQLKARREDLYLSLLRDVYRSSLQWNRALLEIQKDLLESSNVFLEPGFQIKENCHVRFVNLCQSDGFLKGSFPNNDHLGLLVQVKGSIVRMTKSRLLEYKREYVCGKCKMDFVLEAKYEKMYVFEVPRTCQNSLGTCKGTLRPKSAQPKPEFCMDYQEIKIQELFTDKNVPASLIVTLDNDLVDTCQPGECVTICGTIERRWRPFSAGKRSEVTISMRVYGLCKEEQKVNFNKDYSEQLLCIRAQWQDSIDKMGLLPARDTIVRSICPDIHGMYLVKLAIALSLCSGIELSYQNSETRTRGHSHLLLVGDPGLAKSKLLKAASKISLRSVHTTGFGCSAAGLTAAAIKEGGEWQLEAGALVLADGGVCCIDEFNLMRENDKASIHEAMEQQTISMAKAGLVCKLSTRCVLLAATNLKGGHPTSKFEGAAAIDLGIGSPLLSRFDIVLILRDEKDHDWDVRVTDHILNFEKIIEDTKDLWDLERLQTHFLAVHEIKPKISNEASTILAAYYQFCRFDPYRDPSRTTVRLLDSLHRLAQAHAKLTFRDNVEGIDALIIIRLLEFSWGFGRLLHSGDILKEDIPLGPNEEEICDMLRELNLAKLEQNILNQKREYTQSYRKVKIVQSACEKRPFEINDLEKRFGFHKRPNKNLKPKPNGNIPNEVERNLNENAFENNYVKLPQVDYRRDTELDTCPVMECDRPGNNLKFSDNLDLNDESCNLYFNDNPKKSKKTVNAGNKSVRTNGERGSKLFVPEPKPGPSKVTTKRRKIDFLKTNKASNFYSSSDEDAEIHFDGNYEVKVKANSSKTLEIENELNSTKSIASNKDCTHFNLEELEARKSVSPRETDNRKKITTENTDAHSENNHNMDFSDDDLGIDLELISNQKAKEKKVSSLPQNPRFEEDNVKDKENQLPRNCISENSNKSKLNDFSERLSAFGVLDFDDDDLDLDVALNISTQSNIRLPSTNESLQKANSNISYNNEVVINTNEGGDEFEINLRPYTKSTIQVPEDKRKKLILLEMNPEPSKIKPQKFNPVVKERQNSIFHSPSPNQNCHISNHNLPTPTTKSIEEFSGNNKNTSCYEMNPGSSKPNFQQPKSSVKEKQNSIFDTPSPNSNVLAASNRSSCHILASQNVDLDCLEFDI